MTDIEIKTLFEVLHSELVSLGITIEQSLSRSNSYDVVNKIVYATNPFAMDKLNRYLFSEAIITERTKGLNLTPLKLGEKIREYILPDDEKQFYNCYVKNSVDKTDNIKKYEKTEIIDITAMAEELFVSPMMVKHRGIDLGLFDTN